MQCAQRSPTATSISGDRQGRNQDRTLPALLLRLVIKQRNAELGFQGFDPPRIDGKFLDELLGKWHTGLLRIGATPQAIESLWKRWGASHQIAIAQACPLMPRSGSQIWPPARAEIAKAAAK